jgi:anti-anti-sigma factor
MDVRVNGDVVVIDIRAIPADEHELPARVRALVTEGHRKFVVNLAGLPWLDSSGLGGVAGAYTTALRHGGGLVLTSAPPAIRTLLDHTRLSTVIPTFDSEPEAIASLTR